MKKLLLSTAAVALAATFVASPANAQVKLDLGGHFKGYMTWHDQDDGNDTDTDASGAAEDARSVDILRETEVHFSGETTLDNGLTVGAHIEAEADGSDTSGANPDDFSVEESYVYFSGAWGRVNFGAEDGAAYLLQVSAPSADSNLDGIRQWVSPVRYALHDDDAVAAGAGDLVSFVGVDDLLRFDYDQAVSDFDNKITYMTPVFNGFQAGVSYTPEMSDGETVRSFGVNIDDEDDDYGSIWDVGARYEGQLDQVGVTLGAGWTHAELEEEDPGVAAGPLDDRQVWNAGIDLDWKAFGLGVAYLHDDMGIDASSDRETWVVGLDYTTGPFKLGASYYDQDLDLTGLDGLAVGPYAVGALGDAGVAVTSDLETQRWTGGVVYTYGPGMTFRGSVSYIDHELAAEMDGGDFDATSVLLGTQIDF